MSNPSTTDEPKGSRVLDFRTMADDAKQKQKSAFDMRVRRTPGSGRIRRQELPVFSRALGAMLQAGLPVVQCLRSLEQQSESKTFRHVIGQISKAVEYGNKLSSAMSLFPDIFDTMYTSMLKTGEISGQLAETMESLATHLEESADLRRQVQSALMYPVAVAGIAMLLATLIMLFIVPAFDQIYQDLGGDLPTATKLLIAASNILRHHLLWVVVGVVSVVVIIGRLKRTRRGKYVWDRCTLSIPVFGPLMQKVALARFTESFSQMLNHGIPILRALALSGEVMGNEVMKKALVEAGTAVEQGETLSSKLRKSRWYPPLLINMLATGEKTGKVDELLERVATFYRNEVSVVLKGMTSLIEPMLIVFLGVVIGGMVVCMFIPIFKLHELVKF